MGKAAWATVDNLLKKLQMDAVEQHIHDRFTLNLAQRNRTNLAIQQLITVAPKTKDGTE